MSTSWSSALPTTICVVLILCSAGCEKESPSTNSPKQPEMASGRRLLFKGDKAVDRDSGQEVVAKEDSVNEYDILVDRQCSPSTFVQLLDGIISGHKKGLRIKVSVEGLGLTFETRLPTSHEV